MGLPLGVSRWGSISRVSPGFLVSTSILFSFLFHVDSWSIRNMKTTATEIRKELKKLASARVACLALRFFKTGAGQYGEGDCERHQF